MFKKNIKPILMAGALALATAVSPVLAKQVPNEDGTTTTPALDYFRVEKVFQYPEGVNQPEVTFYFNATSTTADAATMTIAPIIINSSDTPTIADGISTVKDYGNITFSDWSHAGVYEYTVTEKSTSTGTTDTFKPADGVVYDLSSYKVRVYVENIEDRLEVKNITAIKTTGTKKVEELSFTNTYNDTTKQRLTITKNTVGKQADLTKSFRFTITLKKPAVNANDATSVTGKISNKKTPALTKDVEVTYGTPTPFTLANGETLVFADLQAGTTYSITENGVKDGYTPSLLLGDASAKVEYKEGVTVLSDTKDEASVTGTGIIKQVTGQYGNTATFTNTYKDSPLTGVIVNNMPYIALLGASGAGLVVLAASKKRSKK